MFNFVEVVCCKCKISSIKDVLFSNLSNLLSHKTSGQVNKNVGCFASQFDCFLHKLKKAFSVLLVIVFNFLETQNYKSTRAEKHASLAQITYNGLFSLSLVRFTVKFVW